MDKHIFKYLQNKLSKEERAELEQWLATDPENVRLFKNFVGHWNLSDFDVDLMKHKVLQRIPGSDLKNHSGKSYLSKYGTSLLRIAAIIVLGLSIAFYFVRRDAGRDQVVEVPGTTMIEKFTERGQKLTVQLPDGSMVKLNADSKLTYPERFGEENRKITLTGEAFFDVQRDEKKPFIIQSNQIKVEVLGTSFNVNDYPDQKEVSVAVRSGKVAASNNSQTIETVLSKQEKLILSGNNGSFRKEIIEDEQMEYGWIDNYLSFNDLNLEEAMGLVSKWFDVEFRIYKNENFDKLVTAKFNNPTLKNVMENLSYSYEFNYEINGKEIMIK